MVGLLRLPSPSKGHMMLTDSINALVFEGANHGALGQNLSSMPNAHGALGQNLSSMANAHGALGQSQRFHENAPPVTPPRLLKKNVDHFFFTQTFFLRKISNFFIFIAKKSKFRFIGFRIFFCSRMYNFFNFLSNYFSISKNA